MTIPVEVLEAEVLNLPPPLRSRLLDKLIASLDTDSEWEQAWAQEADRREAAIADGQSAWVPGDTVLARVLTKLPVALCADGTGVDRTGPREWQAKIGKIPVAVA